MKYTRALLPGILCLAASGVLTGQTPQPAVQGSTPATVTRLGTARMTGTDPGVDDGYLGIREGPEVDETFAKPQISGSMSPARVPADHVPAPEASALAS